MKKFKLTRQMTSARHFASKEFTDRDSFMEGGESEISTLLEDGDYFKVMSYYGLGGIGKTALLKQLYISHESKPLTWIRVDLESSEIQAPVDVLYLIYRVSGVRYFPFEFALGLTWERKGVSIHDIRNRLVALDGVWSAIGDTALSTLPGAVDFSKILRFSDKLADAVRKKHHEADVKGIQLMSDSERERSLPGLLAQGIEAHVRKKRQRLVVSIDPLDNLTAKPGFSNQGDQSQEWLIDLIGESQCGLWLLAGREKLRWHEDISDWNQVMEQHLVGVLSEEDSARFLRSVRVTEPKSVAAIVESSKGVPMTLDLAASLYLTKKEKGLEPQPGDFLDTADGMLKQYLSHLDKDHAKAIRCLALLDEFDYELAAAALRSWSIQVTVDELDAICNSIMALRLEGGPAQYRIHRLVREPVRRSVIDMKDKTRVLKELIHKAEEMEAEGAETSAWAFGRCLQFIREHRVGAGDLASKLFLVGYRVMEAGGYGSFAPLVRTLSQEMPAQDGCRRTQVALNALCAYLERRTGRLREAHEVWKSLGSLDGLSQDASGIIRYLAAHTEHLLGNYADAARVYKGIVEESGGQGGAFFPYAVRQLADIRMLQGDFEEALGLFNRSRALRPDNAWQAETLRHIGHVYRHNFLFAEAHKCYDEARKLAESSGAKMMLNRLKTNYVELYSWQQPEEALALLEEAKEGNEAFENYIEVGKCLTAGAIASALTGRGNDAENQAREALKVQTGTGYVSGQLFAFCALALTQLMYESAALARETRHEILVLERNIGVYTYYRAVLDYCLGEGLREDVAKLAAWLRYRETMVVFSELSVRVQKT